MSQSITRSKASVFSARPSFQRTALASAIMMTMVTTGTQAKEWSRNVEVFGRTEFGGNTDNRMLLGVQWLEPVWQDQTSMLYLDFRGVFDPGDTEEFNLGTGYRRMFFDRRWIFGGYASFDTRDSINDNRFNQITFGLEALSREWDLRANGYIPLTDEKTLGPATFGGRFQGTRLFTGRRTEEAMHGVDFEVGRLLDFIPVGETRLYIGGYHFDGDVVTNSTGFGKKLRLEYRPQKHVALNIGAEDDTLFGTTAFVRVNFSFGYPAETGVRTLDERMVQFAERDVDVRTTGRLPEEKTTATGPGNDLLINSNVVHIKNTADDGGDGSFENPYNDFGDCLAGRCTSAGSLVYVHAGDGNSTGHDQTFTMANNQQLIGQGFNLFGIGGDQFPILTPGAGDGVVLAKNNEIAGVQIDGAPGRGVYGENPGNFSIHDNRIFNSGYEGIEINTRADSIFGNQTSTGRIANNTFRDNYGGLLLDNEVDDGHKMTQNITISNNVFRQDTYYGGEAMDINTDVKYGSTATQSFKISGNRISGSGHEDGVEINNDVDNSTLEQSWSLTNNHIADTNNQGIEFDNDVYAYGTGTSRLTQDVVISGNTITGNDDEGIEFDNEVDAYDSSTANLTQDVVISGNTITGNDDEGITIDNEAEADEYATTSLTQNLVIRDNTITDNDDEGIYIDNYAEADDYATTSLTQNLVIRDNTITDNGDEGIYIDNYADAEDYSTANLTQDIVISGNTITGNDDEGIEFDNGADADEYATTNLTQDIVISGNTITGNDNEGIEFDTEAEADDYATTSLTQNLVIRDNTITDNGDEGIYIDNYASADDYATTSLTQSLVIRDNTITGNDGEGIEIDNEADAEEYGTASLTQDVVISGNTITGNDDEGIGIGNFADGDGNYYAPGTATASTTQNVVIRSNTISDNGGGVYIENDAFAYGGASAEATQTINLDNNLIRNNAGDGLQIDNYAFTYSGSDAEATQTVDLSAGGNDITGNARGAYIENRYDNSGGGNPTANQTVDFSGGNTVDGGIDVYAGSDPTQNITLP